MGPYAARASSMKLDRVGHSRERIDLHGVAFDRMDERECVARVLERSLGGQGGWLLTANLDILRQCHRDDWMRGMAQAADMVVADGMPLIWASRLQGTPLPERVCGSNLIISLPQAAAQSGLSIFLLGGARDSAVRAAQLLSDSCPGLRVAGTYSPPLGFEHREEEIQKISDTIDRARPDIVFVALGTPKGERLIHRLRERSPQVWWIGVGISFSFVCGEVRRAPVWVQRIGFEWVHRLVQEPRRLGKRYLIEDMPFAFTLLGGAMRRRLTRRVVPGPSS